MPGRLVLAGSGEFTHAMREIDYALLGAFGPAPARVAIVPTAAGREDTPPLWAERGISHFRALGADPFAVMVTTRAHAEDPASARSIAGADWLYFSGGDPGYAVETLEGTPFWAAVLERHRAGAILAGSSAGAMMLGQSTFVPVDADPETGLPRDVRVRAALRVVPGVFVFPHFDAIPASVLERWQHLWPSGLRLLALDEDTAIVSGEEGWTVHGAGRALVLRRPGDQRVFANGMAIEERVLPVPA